MVPQTQLRGSAERSVWTGLSAGSETTTDQRLGLEQVTLWASASFREQDSDNPLQYEKEGSPCLPSAPSNGTDLQKHLEF